MANSYAVIDFETTGFNARGNDRVVEVGVALLRSDLSVEGTWSSVLNPERDLGPTHIHGLTGAACLHAPVFAQIAAEFLEALDGRILASHNWPFDSRFLSAEVGRLGKEWSPTGLCTMKLAGRVGLPRTLDGATAELGLGRTGNVHGALEDAILAAEILRKFHEQIAHELPDPAKTPRIKTSSRRSPVSREVAAPGAKRRIPRSLIPGLDEIPWPKVKDIDEDALEEYCALLLDVLGDGKITKSEVTTLNQTREMLEIDGPHATIVHKAIFDGARRLAWADDKLAAWEQEQLSVLADQLGVPRTTTRPSDEVIKVVANLADQVVVFTGEHSRSREELQDIAIQAGATIKESITRAVTMLVAADPTSLSGKAKRAREYEIPIISVEDFLKKAKL